MTLYRACEIWARTMDGNDYDTNEVSEAISIIVRCTRDLRFSVSDTMRWCEQYLALHYESTNSPERDISTEYSRKKAFNRLKGRYAEVLQTIKTAIWKAYDRGYVSAYVEIPFHNIKVAESIETYLQCWGFGVSHKLLSRNGELVGLTIRWG